MADAPWPRAGVPRPAYRDSGGPWWEVDEIAHWWVRPRKWVDPGADGFEARHKSGRLGDVRAPSLYLLAVFTWQRQFRYVWSERETSAT